MYVRMKFGRYAGEIRDIASVEARIMLADGRAEDPFASTVSAVAECPPKPAPRETHANKYAKRTKKGRR